MMQVSSDRNTGEINHNSSHLDNLISFYKFVQVHLGRNNTEIINSILKYGNTVGIVPVTFDKGDRIVILDGPFKDYSGQVVAVNKRNKRINIQLDFMNGMRIVGLTYQEVNKQDNLNTNINTQN